MVYICKTHKKSIYTKRDQLSLDNGISDGLYFIIFTNLFLLRNSYIILEIRKKKQ